MIRGTLVVLRLFREEDLRLLPRWGTEESDLPDWGGRRVESEIEARDRFTGDSGFWSTDRGRLVIEPASGRKKTPAGFVSFWRPAPSVSDGFEIGIYVAKNHRRRGYGTEAQSLLAGFLFESRPTGRVQATTVSKNAAERGALEKAGFRFEGILRDWSWSGGKRHDAALYAMTRGDWEARRTNASARSPRRRSRR